MSFKSRNLQRLSQRAVAPFVALSVVGYFIYHSIQGDRGILAWVRLQEQLAQATHQLNTTIRDRKVLEGMVQDLRPDRINRDLLDQQVRHKLGYAHPDEVIILQPEEDTQSISRIRVGAQGRAR